MSDVEVSEKDISEEPENNAAGNTLSPKERFYSVAIFVIFVLCIVGIWKIYALVVGVLLGVLLIAFHGIVQRYERKKDGASEDIHVVDIPCEPDEPKEDTSKTDVCIDCEGILPHGGTRLSSPRKSSLPSVTEVEIALHFFHALGVITEVPTEDLEDEGFGNEAFETDMDDIVCSGSSSPPTYTDSRYIYNLHA